MSTRQRRRVAVITGTRADYGLLCSPMQAIRKHRKLHLQLVVTGMHLLPKFGRTVEDVTSDGWRIDARVRMQTGSDGPTDQADGLARGVAGIAKYLDRADTDIVLVLGDRIEAMAGALAAITTGRFLAHIHGGDLAPGDADDSLRHAITKLAHLHLPATQSAAKRIIRMGEDPERVQCVGAPGLDQLIQLRQAHGLAKKDNHALIVQHPCGRPASRERRVMRAILDSVHATGLATTIVYPNSDRGHLGIVEAIEAHRDRSNGSATVVRSLDRTSFLKLLINSRVLLGNSSCGVIEAAAAGTPVVNVGSRQAGRQRNGRSVVDTNETADGIREGLRTALKKRPIIGCNGEYGDGRAGRRIAEHIAVMPLTDANLHKLNRY